ncbi:excinuclease Cho [Tatumella saanichensis]|uniref:excinuclease Cho n=1 Tax=Tatumella saanichensis TaxID=480813 RepID=UPI0004A4AE6F
MVMKSRNYRWQLEKVPFVYPVALRENIESVPAVAGVYFFYGESETLPLYIGKSVNLRSRLLSHLRNPDEAKLLRQTRYIRYQETAGEISALLLEAQLIKQLKPLYNKRLRKLRQLHTLKLDEQVVDVVSLNPQDVGCTENIFGLFKNRFSARNALMEIADRHALCYGLLGIEKNPPGRACFRHALRKCSGACCGVISLEQHQAQLREALEAMRVICWPWPGRIALREGDKYQVIDHWVWLGEADSLEEAQELTKISGGYDIDSYKILCRPLLAGHHDIIPLP